MNGNLGIAAFAGVGGAQGPKLASGQRTGYGQAPIGASVGYRRALGASRAISFYGAPFYGYFRNDFGNATKSTGLFRLSIGGDFALTRALGLTVGVETGQNRRAGDAGPSAAMWGGGVSYAFGRR
jgi:hypothetical protein